MNKYKENFLTEPALDKIRNTPKPKVKNTAIAYSGGVDSFLGIVLLNSCRLELEILRDRQKIMQQGEPS